MSKYLKFALVSLCLPRIGSAAPQHQEPCAMLGDLVEKAAKENQRRFVSSGAITDR